MQCLGEILAEQSIQVLAKNADTANERGRLSRLDGRVMILSADLQQALVQNTTDEDLLEGVKTALALQKTAYQQRISSRVKERRKLVANMAAIDAESRQYRPNIDIKLGWLHVLLGDDVLRRRDKAF